MQLLGIEVAKPLGGAGTAGGNRLVAGTGYALGGEGLQQGTGDQGLAHVGVGARDEIGSDHDDSSAQFKVALWRHLGISDGLVPDWAANLMVTARPKAKMSDPAADQRRTRRPRQTS
ncbi:hypothetical protein D3C85_1435730 [compost metagenome]